MLPISIAVSLFALLGGMHLLAKAQKETLGKFFTWISYLIIVTSLALLAIQCTHGVMRMCYRHGICAPSEDCMPGMMQHRFIRIEGDGKHSEEMEECHMKMKGDDACCGKMKHGKCSDMEEEEDDKAKPDSAKK